MVLNALPRAATDKPLLLHMLQQQEKHLQRAYQYFSGSAQDSVASTYAAEWLLDNYFIVQQAIRQIREDMPTGYYRQLPKLTTGQWADYPRIYMLAHDLIADSHGRINIETAAQRLQTFQTANTPLTMGEVWAFPTMLRLGILDRLAATLQQIIPPQPTTVTPAPAVDDTLVGNYITSLRAIAIQDWKTFFETVSHVEQILRTDPANVYPSMDFDTRNNYRTVVEHLARRLHQPEEAVARQAIALTQAHVTSNSADRTNHVGYYLIDAGYPALEASLHYRPTPMIAVWRALRTRPTATYVGSILLLTVLFVILSMGVAASRGSNGLAVLGVGLLTLLPFSAVAVTLVNWTITHAISPQLLPRLDFQKGIPADCKTMVVIPTLLSDAESVDSLLQQLELHYLRNTDANLYFALLTDYEDAPQQHLPTDDALISRAQAGIAALNTKYPRDVAPFYLFHRERQWNPQQDAWIGWERKRGKLVEFNQLLRPTDDSPTPSFTIKQGDLSVLPQIRYVITLDADSILPEDSARLLVATLAHPLNQAVYDAQRGKVVAGYGILQPRVEIKPTSANQSLFTRIFSGEVGLDLYTHAVSDVYQDLFGEGSYVGKGIYDVAAFEAATANRIPENTLLSHDLFEGLHARVGLVTDIALFEEYPARYLGHMRRLHRWVRGDWQLLPWLFPHTPTAKLGKSDPTHLSLLDYWKILDNLRRSLVLPALLVLFVVAWLGWLSSPLVWTLLALATMTVPVFVTVFVGLSTKSQAITFEDVVRGFRMDAWRWWLTVTFLPYEALLTLDAIGVTLWRMFVTRKYLLQWTTAARTASLLDANSRPAVFWREMIAVPVLVAVLTVVLGVVNLETLPVAAPLLTLWFISPQIAYWISRPTERLEAELSEEEKVALRQLARQTWLFFEQMVGPEDHWLPPDHYQDAPRVQIAHRTSPTNIGMFMLSTLSAYDLGFMGPQELLVRLQATFATMESLEHYRGHLLNWYDTLTLEPLTPRYVSTVDSGNLAGNLIVIKQACLNLPNSHVINPQRWQGVLDTLDLVEGSIKTLLTSAPTAPVNALQTYTVSLRQQVQAAMFMPDRWASLITLLMNEAWAELSRLIIALLSSDAATPNAEAVNGLRITSERLYHHIVNMHGDMDLFLPWMLMLEQRPTLISDPASNARWTALLESFPASPTLHELITIYDTIESRLQSLQSLLLMAADQDREAQTWCGTLASRLTVAKQQLNALLDGYQQTALSAEAHFRAMRFDFLYNPQRQIFYIGYNVTGERLDENCYDLLASEARLASVLAIAKRDVPQEHWLHLGRAMTSVVNTRTLLSWSGTMFEYLMPALVMRSYENTLLTQSNRAAVDYQISYANERNVPWGISESSYYAFDGNMTYQYRAFGVPGLGFKRGLTEDLVITPYASMLALPIRPHAARHNMDRLDEIGMRGRYGFYESVDFSRARLARRQDHAVIRSYMAHHQGMIMVSVTNYLLHDVMIERFHADPAVQSVEMLLQEKIPTQGPIEYPHQDELIAQTTRLTSRVSLNPWQVQVDAPSPQVHVLSNGRFTTLLTSAGGGFSQWNGLGLTRWQSDTTRDHWGLWLYVQDLDTGALWSVGYQPTTVQPDSHQVLFYPHQAEFQRRDNDIALHMQVTVSADDDVEIRQVTLINHSDRPRRLRIVSYGEVMLAGSEPHPAFNKLFIQSEYIASNKLLLFHRRLRASDEAPIYMGHMVVTSPDDAQQGRVTYDGDRACFLGRGQMPLAPDALQYADSHLTQTVGITLDPIMSLGHEVTMQPHGRTRAAFLTLATTSRQAAVELATRYQVWPAINRAFDNSLRQNESLLRQLDLGTAKVAQFQQLLSMLLYPYAGLRASADVLAANTKGQSGLWAYAISGDYPILLVLIRDDADLPLVQELLQAHTYWRDQQVKIDLVIANLHDSSYSQELQGQLHRLIVRSNSATWLNQRGGIFVVNADQMSKPDFVLLQTAARAVLDSQHGTLAEQLNRSTRPISPLPSFTPALFNADQPEPTPVLPRPTDLRYDNGSGGFSSDGKEYVIYLDADHWTPVPWVNVIGYESFGFLVSETGAGYTWAGNSSQNRLTPWHNDPVSDGTGEALYLRDEETANVWSPMPLPSRDNKPYLIRHGAGYSHFEHHSEGLKQTTQLFAAPDAPVKVIKLRLENAWNRPRRITVTYYAEWVLEVSRANAQSYVVPEYDHTSGALLACNSYNTEFSERVAFLAANKAPHGLTADRTEFLGRMGSPARPAALTRIGLASRIEPGGDPCAALQLHIDLPVGGIEEVFFILGEGANKDDALALIKRFQQPDQVEAAWRGTHEFWDRTLGTITVRTPDPSMDIMLNRWLLYQALSCRIWGRSGFYQSSGAYGFRDQLQDVMALLHANPDIAKQQIINAAQHQFEAGDVLHWWHPPSGRGVRTRFSDDLLWLPFVVAHYINTTGDYDILREEISFLRGPSLKPDEEERYGQHEITEEKYSLYEHVIRAIKRGSTSGSHGLPLMGTGDWNDGMNRVGREGRGESVWVGWFLYSVLMSTAPLCDFMEDNDRAASYRDQAQKLKATIDAEAWDGQWYRRAYYDDKTPLGSAQNPECQIDSIAQSWAVISGAGEPAHTGQAMQSVVDRLIKEKEQLVLLFTPPFDKSPRDPGYIKGYPPGVRENGGQYTHAALWVVWAFAQMGDGNRAQALFKLLNPIQHSDTSAKAATYKVEPYVIAADVYGVAPHTGRGGWTWYTGSASWMYRLGIEAILGIKRMGDKLILDPCIPAVWDGYDLTYRDGETHYTVHITNPDHVNRGVVEVVLDGNPIPELHIPLSKDGGTHEVHVKLGRTAQVEPHTITDKSSALQQNERGNV